MFLLDGNLQSHMRAGYTLHLWEVRPNVFNRLIVEIGDEHSANLLSGSMRDPLSDPVVQDLIRVLTKDVRPMPKSTIRNPPLSRKRGTFTAKTKRRPIVAPSPQLRAEWEGK